MKKAGDLTWRIQVALLMVGLTFQASPVVWAQLEDVDPALHAAVEALVAKDPEVANNPELAQICRDVAEATVVDPRERAAVTHEVVELHREGTDLRTVVPPEVREAAREGFTRMRDEMARNLETLPQEERARVELMMREGERQMQAFESGEHYVPSPEMVAHAEGMMHEWEADMTARGAPPEFIERARMEFASWSSGEMGGMMGPGQEMMGPGGAGGEHGNMPSLEQMQTMVDAGQMTPEQLQMAKDYMANPQEFMSTHPGYETLGPEAMGSGGPPGGTWEGGATWEAGPHEGIGMSPTEAFEHWATENPNVSPEQMEQYREMAEQYRPENQNYDNLQQQQFDQLQPPPGGTPPPQPEVLVAVHDHDGNGIPDEYHYDTNGDGIADHAHPTPH